MDKRYQVFVSSTYSDLIEERKKIIQTLMEMDCIPSGMELFPAIDEEQWEFIKKVIDDCDYYLLLIGGRYGSVTTEGISYTEKEFEYAMSKGIRVLAFIHADPDAIQVGKTDKNPELAAQLAAFVERAKTARLVKFWSSDAELPGLVALSLTKTIKSYPAVGWVRATGTSSTELLEELNTLRKNNAELVTKLNTLTQEIGVPLDDLADLDENFTVRFSYRLTGGIQTFQENIPISWRDLFATISPYLVDAYSEVSVENRLAGFISSKKGKHVATSTIEDQDFQTIKIQLQAYGLIKTKKLETTDGTLANFWWLTPFGNTEMIRLRAIRKST